MLHHTIHILNTTTIMHGAWVYPCLHASVYACIYAQINNFRCVQRMTPVTFSSCFSYSTQLHMHMYLPWNVDKWHIRKVICMHAYAYTSGLKTFWTSPVINSFSGDIYNFMSYMHAWNIVDASIFLSLLILWSKTFFYHHTLNACIYLRGLFSHFWCQKKCGCTNQANKVFFWMYACMHSTEFLSDEKWWILHFRVTQFGCIIFMMKQMNQQIPMRANYGEK